MGISPYAAGIFYLTFVFVSQLCCKKMKAPYQSANFSHDSAASSTSNSRETQETINTKIHAESEPTERDNETRQRTKIRSMFNSIASTYDLLNHLLSFGIDKNWRKRTIREMALTQDSRVLDLATGTGDLSAQALKKNPAFIVGADPAFNMLIKTQNKLNADKKKSQNQNTHFYAVESFGEFLPFAEESFSHAMIAYGIRNVSNRRQVFSEIYRVLKKDGVFAILEFSQSPNKFFAAVYAFYFHKLLPFVGGLISGNKEAYQYLPQSVQTFPAASQLSRELQEVGFEEKKILPMFFGITTLTLVKKSNKTI